MSRIDEAWTRMTGAAAETRAPAILERFALEKAPRLEPRLEESHHKAPRLEEESHQKAPRLEPRLEESNVSNFVTPVRHPERKPPVSQMSPPPPAPAAQQPSPAPAAQQPSPVPAAQQPAPAQSDTNLEAEPKLQPEKLVDVRQMADYAGFFFGSLRRHKMLATGTFALALSMTAAAAILMPKTYHIGTKLLAQRNAVMTALSNPGRAVPWDADAPTRAAAETVLKRSNLIALMGKTDLIAEWDRTRVPLLKLKDWLNAVVLRRHRPSPDERLDQMVGLLESRMMVVAGPVGDGTVTIDLDWPDAQVGYRLVQEAQQAFIEARQAAETTAIGESITILERYSSTLHEDINRTMTELQRTQKSRRPAAGAPRATSSRRVRVPVAPSVTALLPRVPSAALGSLAVGASLDDPELPRLKAALASNRQEIASLEDARQRQLSELQARYAQLATVYTATHPSVVGVQQNIAVLSRDSSQLVALKAQTEKLEAEYQRRSADAQELLQEEQLKSDFANRAEATAREPQLPPQEEARTPPPAPAEQVGPTSESEALDFPSIRLRLELNQLESVLERTDGARIELAVSQAAFKYRYAVIRPAQVPRSPVKPNLPLVIAAGFVASLLLAFASVVAKDLLSNRILERWQIERQLGLPILGTLGIA